MKGTIFFFVKVDWGRIDTMTRLRAMVFFVHYYCNVMCFETWGSLTVSLVTRLFDPDVRIYVFEGGVALEMLWREGGILCFQS